MNKQIIFGLILLLLVACQQKHKQPVLARVDGLDITLDEFKQAYQFNPFLAGIQNPDSAKWFVLKSLIAEKLIALQARDKSPQIAELLEAYRREAMIEAFWNEVIEPQVHITKAELRQAYLRSKTKKIVQYLIFADRTEAQKASELLQKKMRFEELARLRGFDAQSILTDTITFSGTLPHIEDQVFKMKVGQVSAPLKEGLYYFILKVIGEQRDIFTSEQDFNAHKNSLRKRLKRRKMQEAMQRYLAQHFPRGPYQLSKQKVKHLAQLVEKSVFSTPNITRKEGFTSDLPDLMQELDDASLTQPLVTFADGRSWSGKQLFKRLSFSSYPLLFDSKGMFRKSFLLALKNVLDDQVIFSEARKRHLQNSKYVQQQVAMWRDYLLFKKGLADILRGKSLYDPQPIYAFLKKKSSQVPIKLNKTMLDTLRLLRSDMAVLKQHFPGRLAVPVFPLLTQYRLQYQRYR